MPFFDGWLILAYIPMQLRLPQEAKAFIEAEARANASSQNSEIVRAIRERMKRKGAAETAISPRLDADQPQNRTVEHAER